MKVGLDDFLLSHSVHDLRQCVEQATEPTPPKPANTERKRLKPGITVKALDRDNYGTVIEDRGDEIQVRFVSENGHFATPWIAASLLRLADGTPIDPASEKRFSFDLIDSKTFAATEYEQRYIVRDILAAGQPCIVGGPVKTMKTSMTLDLAFSIGTGTPFMGRFDVLHPTNVMVISGESGGSKLKSTTNEIAHSRSLLLESANIFWGFNLPRLSRADHLALLEEEILKRQIGVAILDPAYLCLLSGDTQKRQAANVFDMGSVLLPLTEVGQRTGCTIILIHHLRKNREERYGVPDLEDLAMAGFAEWARQWILIGRRRRFEPGTGHHELWVNAGGSAGHSGEWAVTIDEGTQQADAEPEPTHGFADEPEPDDFEFDTRQPARTWKVTVESASGHRDSERKARDEKKESDQWDRLLESIERVQSHLRDHPAGRTKAEIKTAARLSGSKANEVLDEMLRRQMIEECEIKGKGNNREYPGFKIASGRSA